MLKELPDILLLLVVALLSKSISGLVAVYMSHTDACDCFINQPRLFSQAHTFALFCFRCLSLFPRFSMWSRQGSRLLFFSFVNHHVAITRQVGSAEIFLYACARLQNLSARVLLVLTTRHHALLKTLRIFQSRTLFVMTIGMCYRYIYLLLDIVKTPLSPLKAASMDMSPQQRPANGFVREIWRDCGSNLTGCTQRYMMPCFHGDIQESHESSTTSACLL